MMAKQKYLKKVNTYDFECGVFIVEDSLTKDLKDRVECAEKILEIVDGILSEKEKEKFALLLGNIILNPIYKVKYKSRIPEKYREYNFLSRQQISNRKKREVLLDDWTDK